MGLQTGRSQPTRSQRGGQGGRFPCPLRGLIRPKPPRSQYWLPPFRGPPRLAVWSDTPRSSPSRPGQPSVRQSVPNSVHTQRLPAPAGSSSSAGQEVWPSPPTPPPRTHPLSRFQVGRGPPSAGFRPQEPLAGRTRGTEFRPGTWGAAVSCHPLMISLTFQAPWSAKLEKQGQLILAVTSLLPCSSGWGSFSCQLRSVLVTVEASERGKYHYLNICQSSPWRGARSFTAREGTHRI